MGRLLVLIVPLCLIVGFVLGRWRRPSTDRTLALIKEHARLLAKASKAYRRDQLGEANIYSEAAARLIPPNQPKELT